MRVLGLDLETTGLDTENDAITEIGAVLWDVEEKKPLIMKQYICYDQHVESKMNPEVEAMMQGLCGFGRDFLEEFGEPALDALKDLKILCAMHGVEYIVAHNGENFDRPVVMAEIRRAGEQYAPDFEQFKAIPWLDTKADIPYEVPPSSNKLKHLALDAGFINPFPHRAVTDVLTMLRVMSEHDFNAIVEYSKIPWIVVRAMTSYDDRQLAKDQYYRWQTAGDKEYPKCWVKRIKACELEQEQAKCPFEVVQIA